MEHMEKKIATKLLLKGSRVTVIIFSPQNPKLTNLKATIISLNHASGTAVVGDLLQTCNRRQKTQDQVRFRQ